jgi:hypothetical protein
MMKLRLFLGAALVSDNMGICAMTLNAGGVYQRLPEVKFSGIQLTEHRVVLLAIDKALHEITETNVEIIIYTDCDSVAFEWREEHLADREFCASTQDQDVWNRITKYVAGRNIPLDIKGQDNTLTAFAQLERERRRDD